MVMNKENLIVGNTVLSPQHETFEKEYEKLTKYKKEINAINKQKRIQNKIKTMIFIAILFAVGFSVIYRYSVLYSMEKNMYSLDSKIENVKTDNENLKIKLLKNSNLKKLDDAATKLNMFYPTKSSVIYCDLAKDNFSKAKENKNKNIQENLFKKIRDMLFLF
ncbi:MAG: hypothetical protein Q8900_01660 [Bacillota bacterium]|nr:hypothetical protein [Bacillota bacterium]